jgi:hypothetical protein
MRLGAWIRSHVVLVMLACPAAAIMGGYEDVRRDAPLHVQVRIAKVTPPAATPGECRVEGEIVRVFRNRIPELERRLAQIQHREPPVRQPDVLGRRIELTIHCAADGDRLPLGGALWTPLTRLTKARYAEAFLDGGLRIVRDQIMIIREATDAPFCQPDRAEGVCSWRDDHPDPRP